MPQPTVSVIIPCYNAAPWFRETLDSVLAQTYPALEALVIDDGSTDESAAIAESYGPPVRLIRQANQGESVARNRGIDEAQGEWIAFLDADDVWEARKLEAQVAVVDSDVAYVHTDFYKYNSSVGIFEYCRIPDDFHFTVEELATRSVTLFASMLVRRVLSPRFPEWMCQGEDRIYQMDLAQQPGRVVVVREPLYGYRKHSTSQTTLEPVRMMRTHQGIEEWLARQAGKLDPQLMRRIREHWLGKIVWDARHARRNRRWDPYWAMRKYLEAYAGHPQVEKLLVERIFPRWIYRVKDTVKKTLTRSV